VRRRLLVLVLVCTGLTLLWTPSAGAFIGPFTGVGHGDVDRFHHMEDDGSDPNDPNDDFRSDANDRYRVRFTYSFRIQNDGEVIGRGDGSYLSATYHLEGKNREEGEFNCDPKVEAKPFIVTITGRANNGRVRLHFRLNRAREFNADTYCGANYTAFETHSTFVADSLDFVQGDDGIVVDQTEPRIRPMRKLVTTGDNSDRRVILHEWEISVRPPDPPVDPPGNNNRGPGRARGPAAGNTAICTIDGTARDDRLIGTPDNDVICGFGGDDVIRGRGGHDIVYGSFGNDEIKGGAGLDSLLGNGGDDLLLAKDRRPDFVDGGPGFDRASRDRGKDELRSVERRL
jgi:RTX calcium-binding nonapeptide repeat (4 copies)